jgi:hypothetical protein
MLIMQVLKCIIILIKINKLDAMILWQIHINYKFKINKYRIINKKDNNK